MSKVAVPVECAKRGSDKLKHEEFSMHGKYRGLGLYYNFNVYICEESAYSEFYFKG